MRSISGSILALRAYKAGDSTAFRRSMGESSWALLTGVRADNFSLAAGPAVARVTSGRDGGAADLVGVALSGRWKFGVRKHLYSELSVSSYLLPEVTIGPFQFTDPNRSAAITVPSSKFNASNGALRIGVGWRI